MSDEQKKQDEQEVEAHVRRASDEPTDEVEGEVEAHVRRNVRHDSPRAS